MNFKEIESHNMSHPLYTNGYDNCRILSPEGMLMFLCSKRKANWYYKKGLAHVVSYDPYTLQLNFQPNGNGPDDKFYLTERKNICVACGIDSNLTKHHCVPYCFRKYFPDSYKNHNSHDVVLLCSECHQKYEIIAMEVKKQLVEPTISEEDNYQATIDVVRSAHKIVKYYKYISHDEFEKCFTILENYLGPNFNDDEIKKLANHGYPKKTIIYNWKKYVEELDDLNSFIRFWRQHFVDHMSPKYLHEHWSVDGRYSCEYEKEKINEQY